MTTSTTVDTFTVQRLTVAVPSVRGFQRDYEAAVPAQPIDDVTELVRRGAPWSEMTLLVNTVASHGFLIYLRSDTRPLMQSAGDTADCVAYLMGNHIVAERMFRHDARAMLYAPLRTLIWEDTRGGAWFSVDQPSSLFRSLGSREVADVGVELDRKLAALLEHLGVEAPQVLLQS